MARRVERLGCDTGKKAESTGHGSLREKYSEGSDGCFQVRKASLGEGVCSVLGRLKQNQCQKVEAIPGNQFQGCVRKLCVNAIRSFTQDVKDFSVIGTLEAQSS